jgi:peptide chain release factor subunit 1
MRLAMFRRMPQQFGQLATQLDRLAAFEAGPFPVISLYLNLQPDENGKDRFEPFLRKELTERIRTYATSTPERNSLETDAEKIRTYLERVEPSINGLAMFACSGAEMFEALPLAAPIDAHRLYISDRPQLYPLARILDAYPRYLALLADSHSARIFVFAANALEKTDRIENPKVKHHKQGGWSQARYQRHVENYHLQHAKEVVDAVAKIAREEKIDKIVLSGDETILPLLRDQFPKDIAERIIDVVKLEAHAGEKDVLQSTLAALHDKDAEGDRERVDELLGAYRAGGLATAGVEHTMKAFERGQVDELVVTARPDAIEDDTAAELVRKARQTSAKIRFIENASLLASVGGVGAFLRFKV